MLDTRYITLTIKESLIHSFFPRQRAHLGAVRCSIMQHNSVGSSVDRPATNYREILRVKRDPCASGGPRQIPKLKKITPLKFTPWTEASRATHGEGITTPLCGCPALITSPDMFYNIIAVITPINEGVFSPEGRERHGQARIGPGSSRITNKAFQRYCSYLYTKICHLCHLTTKL